MDRHAVCRYNILTGKQTEYELEDAMKLKFAENLRALRKAKDITQEELAEKLCVSGQIVSRWETGITYPDIELLPVIADYFDVTVDKLLGAVKSEGGEAPDEMYDRLNAITDHHERIILLKEMHRDYPHDMSVLYNLCGETDDITEQRRYTNELLSECDISVYNQRAIEWMVNAETDEAQLASFLNRFATEGNRSRDCLLEGRYFYRKEYEKYEPLKQAHAMLALICDVFPRLTPNADVQSRLWSSEVKLNLINHLTGTSGKSIVAGDGVPDLWFSARFDIGTYYANQLAASGKTEEALSSLEEIVDLCEAYFSLPNEAELSYRCPAFRDLVGHYRRFFSRGPEAGEKWIKIKNVAYSAAVWDKAGTEQYYRLCNINWPCLMLSRFTGEGGSGWFNSIRNDARLLKCAERLQKYAVTEPV